MENISTLLKEDARAKRQARGGQAVAKKRPRRVLTPTDLEARKRLAWWKQAPTIFQVDIATGRVLVDRLAEFMTGGRWSRCYCGTRPS